MTAGMRFPAEAVRQHAAAVSEAAGDHIQIINGRRNTGMREFFGRHVILRANHLKRGLRLAAGASGGAPP